MYRKKILIVKWKVLGIWDKLNQMDGINLVEIKREGKTYWRLRVELWKSTDCPKKWFHPTRCDISLMQSGFDDHPLGSNGKLWLCALTNQNFELVLVLKKYNRDTTVTMKIK